MWERYAVEGIVPLLWGGSSKQSRRRHAGPERSASTRSMSRSSDSIRPLSASGSEVWSGRLPAGRHYGSMASDVSRSLGSPRTAGGTGPRSFMGTRWGQESERRFLGPSAESAARTVRPVVGAAGAVRRPRAQRGKPGCPARHRSAMVPAGVRDAKLARVGPYSPCRARSAILAGAAASSSRLCRCCVHEIRVASFRGF